AKSGAAASNSLGYPGFLDFPCGDAVYHLSFTFDHTAKDLVLNFTGGPGLTDVLDESWGVDNVQVSVGGTGAPAAIAATFTDAGVLDTHTALVNWGDGTGVEALVVTEENGSGSLHGEHVYADDGEYLVSVTVMDDDGASAMQRFTITVDNVVPM